MDMRDRSGEFSGCIQLVVALADRAAGASLS